MKMANLLWKDAKKRPNFIEGCPSSLPLMASEGIEDSNIVWNFKCPLIQENIPGALNESNANLNCNVCGREVIKVQKEDELQSAVEKGQCVVFYNRRSVIRIMGYVSTKSSLYFPRVDTEALRVSRVVKSLEW